MVLPTEQRNPRTSQLDALPTEELVALLHAEDLTVAPAVAAAAPATARLVDVAVAAVRAGGRVHYVGAGTSGRLVALDAAELPGTYGVPDDLFVVHVAGGAPALGPGVDVEDEAELGTHDLAGVDPADVVIGVAASGRTPYVLAALAAARNAGARTALISANPGAPAGSDVDVHVAVDTGPEPLTGSTRMKAATAQKMVLTAFSTAVMVRLGRTWSNLMVGVIATNEKLRARALGALVEASGESPERCGSVLADAGGDARVALVALLGGVSVEKAKERLVEAGGSPRAALAAVIPVSAG